MRSMRVAVLGGGLQGACIAFELASRGVRVDLYERNEICLAEASVHNEGKIHLGYVYAYDKTFETARLMASGAIRFEHLMRRWIGEDAGDLVASSPFQYAVHRNGLMTPEAFEAHVSKVSSWIAESKADKESQYFGSDIGRKPERLSTAELATTYQTKTTAAAFGTPEIAIDPEALARLVRFRLSSEPAIRCLTCRKVVAVQDEEVRLTVTSTQNGSSDEEGYDFVVNALWSGRLAIDAQLGLVPDRPWSFRFKYFLRAATSNVADKKPSTTIVLGPFGDVVGYANGLIYLSWYPAGVSSWSSDLVPSVLPSILQGPEAAQTQQGIIEGLAGVVPGVADLELHDVEIKGAWIFAWGNTDIDDPESGLHQRSIVGTRRHGRYLSVDTGKLTLAPLLAERAVKLMLD